MSADPYLASGGPADPGSWNRYAYVENDPVNFNDPRGLFLAAPGPIPEPEPNPDPVPLPSPVNPRPTNRWVKAQERLSNANDLLQNLTPSANCQKDLNKIATAPGGPTLGEIQSQANVSNWNDATTSTTLERNLFSPGTAAYSLRIPGQGEQDSGVNVKTIPG